MNATQIFIEHPALCIEASDLERKLENRHPLFTLSQYKTLLRVASLGDLIRLRSYPSLEIVGKQIQLQMAQLTKIQESIIVANPKQLGRTHRLNTVLNMIIRSIQRLLCFW
jgi:hypothetical protein